MLGRTLLTLTGSCLVTLAAMAAPAQTPGATPPAAALQGVLALAGDAARGRAAFAECAGCHLYSLPVSGRLGQGPGDDLARGKALFDRDCAACHGAQGEGHAEAFVPMVAAQHHPYLLRELGLIRDGGRGNSNPAMASLVKGYGAADLQAVADHLSRLPPPGK